MRGTRILAESLDVPPNSHNLHLFSSDQYGERYRLSSMGNCLDVKPNSQNPPLNVVWKKVRDGPLEK